MSERLVLTFVGHLMMSGVPLVVFGRSLWFIKDHLLSSERSLL